MYEWKGKRIKLCNYSLKYKAGLSKIGSYAHVQIQSHVFMQMCLMQSISSYGNWLMPMIIRKKTRLSLEICIS